MSIILRTPDGIAFHRVSEDFVSAGTDGVSEAIYDEAYFHDNYVNKESARVDKYRELAEYIRTFGPDTVLDIGAGVGFLVRALREAGIAAEGIEPSRAACEFADRQYGIKISNGDLRSLLPDHEAQYDLITIIDVLAHVPDPADVLTTASRCLKEQGRIVVKTPNRPESVFVDLAQTYSEDPEMISLVSHYPYQLHSWGMRGLTELMTRCGLREVSVTTTTEAFDGAAIRPSDILHPRRLLFKRRLQQAAAIAPGDSLLAVGVK